LSRLTDVGSENPTLIMQLRRQRGKLERGPAFGMRAVLNQREVMRERRARVGGRWIDAHTPVGRFHPYSRGGVTRVRESARFRWWCRESDGQTCFPRATLALECRGSNRVWPSSNEGFEMVELASDILSQQVCKLSKRFLSFFVSFLCE